MVPDPGDYDGADYSWLCNANGSGFACIDPSAECVDDDDVTIEMVENCGDVQGIGEYRSLSLHPTGNLTICCC